MGNCLTVSFCLTAVDTEMLFEVVFVLEGLPTLQTFELPGLHGLIQSTLGKYDVFDELLCNIPAGKLSFPPRSVCRKM